MRRAVRSNPTPPCRHHLIPLDKTTGKLFRVAVFSSPPGRVPLTRFPGWRIAINREDVPLPLKIRDARGRRTGFDLRGDQAVIVAPHVAATWQWTRPASAILLDIPDGFVQQHANALFNGSCQPDGTIALVRDGLIRDTVEQIDQCQQRQREAGAHVARALADIAVIRVIRARAEATERSWTLPTVLPEEPMERVDPIQTLLASLRKQPGKQISLAQMCHRTGLTKSTLLRRFKDRCGETPMRYITRLRINRACNLIADSRLSLSEISLMCGFSDQAHMSRCIKAQTGRSPKSFR